MIDARARAAKVELVCHHSLSLVTIGLKRKYCVRDKQKTRVITLNSLTVFLHVTSVDSLFTSSQTDKSYMYYVYLKLVLTNLIQMMQTRRN